MMIKQVINFSKEEFGNILINYMKDKVFENISKIEITVGSNSHDFISGNGYMGVKLEVETTKEESI